MNVIQGEALASHTDRHYLDPGIPCRLKTMTVTHKSIVVVASLLVVSLLIAFIADGAFTTSSRMDFSDPELYSDVEKYDESASENGIVNTPAIMDALYSPEMLPAWVMEFPDDERVIAIEVAGQHYAYPLSVMNGVGEHIINDIFAGTPITIAFCDMTDCVRVLTTGKKDRALAVLQHGLQNGELALLYGGLSYQLSSDTIPLDQYPHKVVAWPSWRDEHLDGLVYPGVGSDLTTAGESTP